MAIAGVCNILHSRQLWIMHGVIAVLSSSVRINVKMRECFLWYQTMEHSCKQLVTNSNWIPTKIVIGDYNVSIKDHTSTRLICTKLHQHYSPCEWSSCKFKVVFNLWRRLNPKTNIALRIYGRPTVHKEGIHLRPIVDFTNSPSYNLAVYLP